MQGPDFFVVGAPKAGTTALDAYLGAHPEIFMGNKEMHCFGSDLAWGPAWARVSWEDYLHAFAEAGDEKRLGETSPGYLCSTRAAEEIKAYRPEAQIIASLRNPVDMIHSFHSHLLYVGDETIKDLEQALAAEPDRRAGLRIPRSNKGIWALWYRHVARYREQIERYLDAFGEERVHVLTYDDFRRDTAAAYRAVLEFLGVDPGFTPEFEVMNPSKRARIATISAVQSTGTIKKRGALGVVRRAARVAIPSQKARSGLYGWIERRNTVYERQAPMPEHLRERLEAEFADEVSGLGALLDRDLSHWVSSAGSPIPARSH